MLQDLLKAINAHDQTRAEELITQMTTETINVKDGNGNTAIHLAAKNGLDVIVTKILEKVPDSINTVAPNGYIALHIAIDSSHETTAELLLNQMTPELIKTKCINNIQYIEERTVLCRDMGYMDGMVSRPCRVLTKYWKTDLSGANSALHLAAKNGLGIIVTKILEKAPDLIHAVGHNGRTPLHFAVENSHTAIAELLISKMTVETINVQNRNKNTALHLAVKKGLDIIVAKILEKAPDLIHVVGDNGYTSLHFAAENSHQGIAELLISKMTVETINVQDRGGKTALHLAARKGFDVVVIKILEKAPDLINAVEHGGYTPLHFAVENSHQGIAELLISKMTVETISVQNRDKNTALHLAAKKGLDVIVTKIIEKAPDLIHVVGDNGYTSLHFAVENSHTAIAELLISKMTVETINVRHIGGKTALHLAAEKGFDVIVIKILEKAPDLIHVVEEYNGCTPLHFAVENSHTAIAELLISKMTIETINVQDRGGKTALHLAARKGFDVVVIKILEKAPDLINTVERNGYTPLHFAVENSHTAIAELLISKMTVETINVRHIGGTALHLAAKNGLDVIVTKILEKAPDLIHPVAEYNGRTPLHFAVENSHTAIAELLISKMTVETINVQNRNKNTALHLAVKKGLDIIVAKILEKAPDLIHVVGDNGYTSLHFAAENSHQGIAELLVSKMTIETLNVQDRDGRTALHLAARKGFDVVVIKILEKAPDLINAVEHGGYTPLHFAVENSHQGIAELLISKMTVETISVQNRDKNTALHLAAKKGLDVIVTKIIEKAPDLINTVERGGYTPLIYALFHNKIEVAKILIENGASINDRRVVDQILDLNTTHKLIPELAQAMYFNVKAHYGKDGLKMFVQKIAILNQVKAKSIEKILIDAETAYYLMYTKKFGNGRINPASITLSALQEESNKDAVISLKQLCALKISINPQEYFDPLILALAQDEIELLG